MILRGGEREILKTAASTKVQNLPAKSLDGQIKTAKFHLLTPNNGHFSLYTKGGALCKFCNRSSHSSRHFVRIVIERRKETLRKFSGLPVFMAFAYCV